MANNIILLTIPGLRSQDIGRLPGLARRLPHAAPLTTSFPCVTWPAQANLLTGVLADQHGVTANGFYWRDTRQVEMWTAWNEKITAPQIWDLLHQRDAKLTSLAWFPMLSKGSGADTIAMPAPIHNPDGTESLWCYTRPTELYGTLRDALGHFPLQHFWGPLANIKSTAWIVDSAALALERFRPRFSYVYLPHLDYAAQKFGPDSPQALAALGELDGALERLFAACQRAYGDDATYLAASEYVITPVNHVTHPNRALRAAGLLQTRKEADGEHLDLENSQAWALVDHQFSHVYVRDADPAVMERVKALFHNQPGFAEVLAGEERAKHHLTHPRAGEVVLISTPNSWQAYYWWQSDADAPRFARTVDIHRKPGYDPVELCFDPATKSIPLDASLIRGSHGAPVTSEAQRGVLLSSNPHLANQSLRDVDMAKRVVDALAQG